MNFDLQFLPLMKNLVSLKTLISLILNRMNSCSLKSVISCLKIPLFIEKSSLSSNISTKVHHILLTIDQNTPHLGITTEKSKLDFFHACLLWPVAGATGGRSRPLFEWSCPRFPAMARSRCYRWS